MKAKEISGTIPGKNKKQVRKYLLAIFAMVFLLYGNSIKNGYALDDNYVTVTTPKTPDNPRIAKGIRGIPELFTGHYVESGSQSFDYRPFVLTTFAIEYEFFGSNSHMCHFINVLIYALTCMLLFLLLCRIFEKHNFLFPLLITLLFLVHPIHTEVVSNIKCRDELLSFLFGLSSMYFFLNRTGKNRWTSFFLSGLFLLLALLCKKTSVLFIGMIPLTNYFFMENKLKKVILQGLFFYAIFLVSTMIQRVMLPDMPEKREFAFFENPLFYEDFSKRIPLAFYTMGYYFKLFVFPYPLCCYYGYDTIPLSTWSSPFVIISAIVFLGMGIYAIARFPEKNILSYSIIIFLSGIFLFSNLLTPVAGILAERLVYFSSLGFCMGSGCLLSAVFKINYNSSNPGLGSLKPSFKGIILVILFVCSALTISRSNKWKDELTLLRYDTRNFERSCNLHYMTGNDLYRKVFTTPEGAERNAIIKEATFHYGQALDLMKKGVSEYDKDYNTLSNIGTIYVNIFNDGNSAKPFFEKALALDPGDPVKQFNYAFCFEKRNLPDSAILFYEKMLLAHTTYLLAYSRLNELYLTRKEYAKAIASNKKGTELIPHNAQLYINLGNAFLLNKDTLNGIEQFEKAVMAEPANNNLRKQVVDFLTTAGYAEKAKKLH
ncbi:MAG TPA: glycosyltransferase family 39 protein [Bacteroidia bacterium]|nr:glycosyltransferase family 39 protein [Bacteroidia bacterium]